MATHDELKENEYIKRKKESSTIEDTIIYWYGL